MDLHLEQMPYFIPVKKSSREYTADRLPVRMSGRIVRTSHRHAKPLFLLTKRANYGVIMNFRLQPYDGNGFISG